MRQLRGFKLRQKSLMPVILASLVFLITQRQFLASPIHLLPSQPSLNSSIPSYLIDNATNLDLDDTMLFPEPPSVQDEPDDDLIAYGVDRLVYVGVFLLINGIILVIGMLSGRIAHALIGASLLTAAFFVLFFVIIG